MFVFLHVGQCGIQLGAQLWGNVLPIPDGCTSLMIDSESKVVNGLKQVPDTNILYGRKGCGNNWGCGFSSSTLVDKAMDRVRQAIEESCECFMGVVMFHSLAGGTGSGVTSLLLERLRGCYPNQYIISIAVKPFNSGETPLQHYNSLLALSWLQEYSDGVLLIANDDIIKHSPTIATLSDINRVINRTLGHCLQPLNQSRYTYSLPCELVTTLCPLPCCKYFSTSPVYNGGLGTSNATSAGCYGNARSVIATSSQSILCITRGNKRTLDRLMADTKQLGKKIRALYKPVQWNPYPIDYWFGGNGGSQQQLPCSTSVLANTSDITGYFSNVKHKATVMFKEKAYIHWYKKYNIEENTFEESFTTLQDIIDCYNNYHN